MHPLSERQDEAVSNCLRKFKYFVSLCFPWIKESSVDLKTFLESLERLKPLIKPCYETFIASFPNRKSIFTFHKEEGHEVQHQETSTWLYLSIYLYHFIGFLLIYSSIH